MWVSHFLITSFNDPNYGRTKIMCLFDGAVDVYWSLNLRKKICHFYILLYRDHTSKLLIEICHKLIRLSVVTCMTFRRATVYFFLICPLYLACSLDMSVLLPNSEILDSNWLDRAKIWNITSFHSFSLPVHCLPLTEKFHAYSSTKLRSIKIC